MIWQVTRWCRGAQELELRTLLAMKRFRYTEVRPGDVAASLNLSVPPRVFRNGKTISYEYNTPYHPYVVELPYKVSESPYGSYQSLRWTDLLCLSHTDRFGVCVAEIQHTPTWRLIEQIRTALLISAGVLWPLLFVGVVLQPRHRGLLSRLTLAASIVWLLTEYLRVDILVDPWNDSPMKLSLMLFPALLGLTAVFWAYCERRSPDYSHCAQCGYNLRGNVSGICPECGMPVPAGMRTTSAAQVHSLDEPADETRPREV